MGEERREEFWIDEGVIVILGIFIIGTLVGVGRERERV